MIQANIASPTHTSSYASDGRHAQDKTWIQLTYEEYKERQLGREPITGAVELLGQTASLHWPVVVQNNFTSIRHEPVPIAPTIAERANASTIFSAVDNSVPSISIKELAKLSKWIPFGLVHLGC